MQHGKILFAFFFLSNLLIAYSVLAQDPLSEILGGGVNDFWVTALGLPEEWMAFPTFIYNFLLPFIAIFAVSLGLLGELNLYRTQPNVKYVLAFAMAFSTLPTRVFVSFVALSLGVLGVFSYLVFFVLFIVGSLLFGSSRIWGWRGEKAANEAVAKSYQMAFKNIQNEENRLTSEKSALKLKKAELDMKLANRQIDGATYNAQVTCIQTRLAQINTEETNLLTRMESLRRAHTIT